MSWQKALRERRDTQENHIQKVQKPSLELEQQLKSIYLLAQDELDRHWQMGCIDYVSTHRQDLFNAVLASDAEVAHLWFATLNDHAPIQQFTNAIDRWKRLHLTCLAAFVDSWRHS